MGVWSVARWIRRSRHRTTATVVDAGGDLGVLPGVFAPNTGGGSIGVDGGWRAGMDHGGRPLRVVAVHGGEAAERGVLVLTGDHHGQPRRGLGDGRRPDRHPMVWHSLDRGEVR